MPSASFVFQLTEQTYHQVSLQHFKRQRHILISMSATPARSSLADAILQQFLMEADAPVKPTHVPAQILPFDRVGKGRALRVISPVQLHLISPFTLTYWVSSLSELISS